MKTAAGNPFVLPVLILFISAVLGGLPPVAIKVALLELSSPVIMFLRVSIMMPIFFLLSLRHLHILRTKWQPVFLIALGWAGNIIIFSLGIPHTTAAVSQVLYTGVPVIVALLSPWLLRETPTKYQMVGIGVGLVGTIITVFGSGAGLRGGNATGNMLVLGAVISWALYVVATRKYKTSAPASLNLFIGSLIAWVFFGCTAFSSLAASSLGELSPSTIYAVLFLGLIGGVIMFFTHQWGAQRAPAVISASTGYISVISGIIGAWIVLGEQLEQHEWFGLSLLLIAVMLTTTIPLLIRRVRARMV